MIEGEINKKPYSIACNFLNRPEREIEPKVFIFEENQQKKLMDLPSFPINETQLDRIFKTVINDCLNGTRNIFLTNKTIYLVHRIIFEAKQKAFKNYYNTFSEAEKANKRLANFLTYAKN